MQPAPGTGEGELWMLLHGALPHWALLERRSAGFQMAEPYPREKAGLGTFPLLPGHG